MQTTTRMNNKHCYQNYECLLHSSLIQVTDTVFHVALPTALPVVFSPFPSLPGWLSSRCEVGPPFHSHGTAIFQPAATYMLPHLIYLFQFYPWRQALYVDAFQTSSTLHPGLVLGLQSRLHEREEEYSWSEQLVGISSRQWGSHSTSANCCHSFNWVECQWSL